MSKPTPHRRPTNPNCEVVVHGNGFLATVEAFAVTGSMSDPVSLGSLKPGDRVRLEIVPEQGDSTTVQLGLVRWIDGTTVGAEVILMESDAQRSIDEVAWANVRGELSCFRWLRKTFRGDRLPFIQLTFAPEPGRARVRLPKAA